MEGDIKVTNDAVFYKRCLKNCNPKEIDYCITERLIAAAKGDIENALLFCGAKAYIQKDISTVKNVIDELF